MIRIHSVERGISLIVTLYVVLWGQWRHNVVANRCKHPSNDLRTGLEKSHFLKTVGIHTTSLLYPSRLETTCFSLILLKLLNLWFWKHVRKPPLHCYTVIPFSPCDAMRCTVLVIVILSVCPSVRHTRALCPHGSTYDHDFFTIW